MLERREVSRVGSLEKIPIDIRLVCATEMPIYEVAGPHAHLTPASGHPPTPRFPQDLLYRINTVEIKLPPLRERTEDAPLLGDDYLGSELSA